MEKEEYCKKYRGRKDLFGLALNKYYKNNILNVKVGEIAEIRPFGLLCDSPDFVVKAKRTENCSFGQILWELAE